MPKIIENLESKLIGEARRQIEARGYGAVTIRSVAAGCGVGVGTVYNYFSSKDHLLATYMLSDWNACMDAIGQVSAEAQEAAVVVRFMYDQLLAYAGRHSAVFQDEAAAASFAGSSGHYHTMLRSQLAEPLEKFCPDAFTAEFIAEALLTWTMAGKSFDEIYGILGKIF